MLLLYTVYRVYSSCVVAVHSVHTVHSVHCTVVMLLLYTLYSTCVGAVRCQFCFIVMVVLTIQYSSLLLSIGEMILNECYARPSVKRKDGLGVELKRNLFSTNFDLCKKAIVPISSRSGRIDRIRIRPKNVVKQEVNLII